MEGSTKYATFFLIFSIVFTYYSYALAFSTVPESRWDLTLDYDQVFAAGIMLGEADELNLTYGSGWQYFDHNNTEIRVKWDYNVILGYHIRFDSHVKIFNIAITWVSMEIRDYGEYLYNSSLVIEYDNVTEWSQFKFKNGYELFFVDPELENNMTRAVYEDGIVLVTVAESISFKDDVNLMTFVSWYTGTITGTNSYGLPSVFNVILQVISVLSLLSVIILAKEMISL